MKKKIKYYVVWEGHKSGVYNTWEKCKEQINNYKGAKYKSFLSLKEANNALINDYKNYISKSKLISSDELPNLNSISVDAASSGNPGIMEYQGVDTKTKKLLFNHGPFKQGTNNIGEFLALVHGLASITLRGNQLISGVAINFFAAGTTVLIGQNWFKMGGQTPALRGQARFQSNTLPGAETIGDVPVVGPVYEQLISGHNTLVYIALAMVPLTWWLLNRTRFGLHLRAVGENPAAVDTAGINVVRLRYSAVIICGVLCGVAGAYLSLGTNAAGFLKDMTAGKGFIALAALIFAKWRPLPALGACFLFGLLDAIANKYQSLDIGLFVVPVQFMQALPYILTVVILAGFVGKAIPPKAGGEPYIKER